MNKIEASKNQVFHVARLQEKHLLKFLDIIAGIAQLADSKLLKKVLYLILQQCLKITLVTFLCELICVILKRQYYGYIRCYFNSHHFYNNRSDL